MGLDIRFFQYAETVDGPAKGNGGDADVIHNANFAPEQMGQFNQHDSLGEWVRVSGFRGHFRVGSYGSYNDWRKRLSLAILSTPPEAIWSEPERFRGMPMVQLIDFSDCEGIIGPQTCAVLRRQFEFSREKFFVDRNVEQWHYEIYGNFQRAFDIAADTGCVQFC